LNTDVNGTKKSNQIQEICWANCFSISNHRLITYFKLTADFITKKRQWPQFENNQSARASPTLPRKTSRGHRWGWESGRRSGTNAENFVCTFYLQYSTGICRTITILHSVLHDHLSFNCRVDTGEPLRVWSNVVRVLWLGVELEGRNSLSVQLSQGSHDALTFGTRDTCSDRFRPHRFSFLGPAKWLALHPRGLSAASHPGTH